MPPAQLGDPAAINSVRALNFAQKASTTSAMETNIPSATLTGALEPTTTHIPTRLFAKMDRSSATTLCQTHLLRKAPTQPHCPLQPRGVACLTQQCRAISVLYKVCAYVPKRRPTVHYYAIRSFPWTILIYAATILEKTRNVPSGSH